jgi:hypothetical protein
MNKLIKELALQAGAGEWGDSVIPAMMSVEKFAGLIRNDALEEAAKVCDRLRNKNYSSEEWVAGTDDCAAAIRAMKESAQ